MQPNESVIITSKRHFYVILACLLRYMFTEKPEVPDTGIHQLDIHLALNLSFIIQLIGPWKMGL